VAGPWGGRTRPGWCEASRRAVGQGGAFGEALITAGGGAIPSAVRPQQNFRKLPVTIATNALTWAYSFS